MSGNFGPVGDVISCNGLMIKGKQVFNSQGVLTVKTTNINTTKTKNLVVSTNGTICGTLFVTDVEEKVSAGGISVTGNVSLDQDLCLGGVIKIGLENVVGQRQPDISYANGMTIGNVSATANAIIDVLRSHGLIGAIIV